MRLNNQMRFVIASLIAAGLAGLSACGQNNFQSSKSSIEKGSGTPIAGESDPELSMCSKLALKGVTWPSALEVLHKRPIALALNISGSFEGSDGWKNITNNFDGQGLSLGLLNQCLGQGSLQPLLLKFRDRYASTLSTLMGAAHRTSFLSLLTKWDKSQKVTLDVLSESNDEELLPDGRLSLLDEWPHGSDGIGHEESATSDSVTWAKQNLYTDNGTTFQSIWKKELQALASNPSYVSLQIEAAMRVHQKVLLYMKTLALHETRSYLMLFDLCVQNGGLYQDDVDQFKAAFPVVGRGDETSRLKKILDLRLSHVLAKYKADVFARKNSIIVGKGVVHQTNRDYQKEFCFEGEEPL